MQCNTCQWPVDNALGSLQAYGRELSEAYDWLMKYKSSRKEAELHQAGTALLREACLAFAPTSLTPGFRVGVYHPAARLGEGSFAPGFAHVHHLHPRLGP